MLDSPQGEKINAPPPVAPAPLPRNCLSCLCDIEPDHAMFYYRKKSDITTFIPVCILCHYERQQVLNKAKYQVIAQTQGNKFLYE